MRDVTESTRRAATLLGQGGKRKMHDRLEERFAREIGEAIGGELEVTVSICPKAGPGNGESGSRRAWV